MSKAPADRWGFGEVEGPPDAWAGRVQLSADERTIAQSAAAADQAAFDASHQVYALRDGPATLRTAEAGSDEEAIALLRWSDEPGTQIVHSASGRVVVEAPSVAVPAPPAPRW